MWKFLVLALFAGPVLADGVPLFTGGPAIAANDPVRQLSPTRLPDFVKLHPIVLNKAAFGANVLTATVDGKEYRFVGSMMAPKPPPPPQYPEKITPLASWTGKEPGGGFLFLTKDLETGNVIGQILLPPGRRLEITSPGGRAVLVEAHTNLAPQLIYHKEETGGRP